MHDFFSKPVEFKPCHHRRFPWSVSKLNHAVICQEKTSWAALGLQPFLIHPAVIKLRHKEEQRSFDSPQKAEDFISSLSQQKSYAAALRGDDGGAAAAVSPARREGLDCRDGYGPSCPGGDDDRMNMDTC